MQENRIDQFALLYEKQHGIPDSKVNYSLPIIGDMRAERVNQSISHNKDMFLSPFGGLIVHTAAHTFIFQLFANRTQEHPEGIMDRVGLKSFYAMDVCEEKKSWWWLKPKKNCDRSFVDAGNHALKYKYVSFAFPDLTSHNH